LRKNWFGIGIAAWGVALAAPAMAQERPAIPNSVPSRQQVLPPTPQPLRQVPRARVDASKAVRTAPCPLDKSPLTATLSEVRFTRPDGSPLLPVIADALAGATSVPAGPQPLAEVCAIRDRANAALRRRGFIASVQIPPQSLAAGVLRLVVVTARITEIRVHGEPGHYRDALLSRIAKLKALDPLNERDAERVLLLANDIPGLSVQLSLRPAGTAPGAVIGDLSVTRTAWKLIANVQNYGSRQLGRFTGYARAEFYGLLTPTDIGYLGVSTTAQTREQQVIQAGYTTGVFSGGTTVGARFNYAWSRPDLGALDLRSRSIIGGIDIQTPLVRSLDRNLTVGGGAELIEQRTRVYATGGSSPLNLDQLRVLYLRTTGSWRARRPDGTERFSLSGAVDLRRGLDVLGATPRGEEITGKGYTPTRFGADPQAWVVRANVDGVARAGAISAATDVKAQWANHPLLNFEEFAIGNLTSGRGYDPGSNNGDRAVGLSNEVRWDITRLRRLPVQLFAFGDVVWLWNLGQNSVERHRELRSAGGGVRLTLPASLFLELSYAHPFDRAFALDAHRPPSRVLMSLSAQLAPVRH
jgi:hemolysin activation/secretion protein